MPRYVIERTVPGVGRLTPEQWKGIAQKSESVLKDLGPEIKWEHSYVTGDKIYCVYTAPNAEMIREHAKRGGFPADSIEEVSSIIDPSIGGTGNPRLATGDLLRSKIRPVLAQHEFLNFSRRGTGQIRDECESVRHFEVSEP
jgi:hypothetical protein